MNLLIEYIPEDKRFLFFISYCLTAFLFSIIGWVVRSIVQEYKETQNKLNPNKEQETKRGIKNE